MWDYLIVTAANAQQAAAYELQIEARRRIGQLLSIRNVLVVPDPGGRRVGSGGSTVACLREVLQRESAAGTEEILRRLRILIVHAGGDSRRLPAYSPCGKLFVPLPETGAIFDRLVPAFLSLPEGSAGAGQIVVAAGDALLLFDPAGIDLSRQGITALGALVSPETAARHGVFCADRSGAVRLYLQKPGISEQMRAGAIGAQGRSVLDIGVMSMDAGTAGVLLRAFGTSAAQSSMAAHGIDLYREICCALGTEATFAHYLASTRASGSHVEEAVLGELFDALRPIPAHVHALERCDFLHFGSTSQLISSGIELVTLDGGAMPPNRIFTINSEVANGARVVGNCGWVEGCRLQAPLTLHGRNVIVGVDVGEPFELPEGACLDVAPGFNRQGESVWFVRYYGIDDSFKDSVQQGATFCGRQLRAWLRQVGAEDVQIWDAGTPEQERTLWNARVSPAEKEPGAYREWRWMWAVDSATREQQRRFLKADRYSSAEIAVHVRLALP